MDTNQLFLLGYISKKHGYKGNVVLYIDTDHPSYYHCVTRDSEDDENSTIAFFEITILEE